MAQFNFGAVKVNDHFGHARGDQALREVASILKTCVRTEDLVARLGGDEFAVLLVGTPHSALVETAQRLIERVVQVHADPLGHRAEVTCSIGIARYPQDGNSAANLLKKADEAMYTVKGRGKKGYCFATHLSTHQ